MVHRVAQQDLVTLLLDGYRRRLDALGDQPGRVILDRGLATVEASCVASVMLKDDLSARDAEAMVAELRAEVLGAPAPSRTAFC